MFLQGWVKSHTGGTAAAAGVMEGGGGVGVARVQGQSGRETALCARRTDTHTGWQRSSQVPQTPFPDFLPPLENLKVQQKGLARHEEEFGVCAVLVDRTVEKEGGCAHVSVKLVLSLTLGIQWKYITGSSLIAPESITWHLPAHLHGLYAR